MYGLTRFLVCLGVISLGGWGVWGGVSSEAWAAPPTSRPTSRRVAVLGLSCPKLTDFRHADRLLRREALALFTCDKVLGVTSLGLSYYAVIPSGLLKRSPPTVQFDNQIHVHLGTVEGGLRRISIMLLRRDASGIRRWTDRQGVIDAAGHLVIPFRFHSINHGYTPPGFGVSWGRGAVVQCLDGRWGAINVRGQFTVPCVYQKTVGHTEHDLLRFVGFDGKMGVFRLGTGKAFLPPVYDFIGSHGASGLFYKSYEFFQYKGLWGLINRQGKVLLPPRYEAMGYSFYIHCLGMESLSQYFYFGVIAAKLGGKWGVIDSHGRVQHPFVYDKIYSPRRDGRAYFLRDKKEGFLQLTLRPLEKSLQGD
jgi:hypothetical protein